MQVVLTEHHILENISFRDTTIAGKGIRTAFACSDTRPRFPRSHRKDRPIQSL